MINNEQIGTKTRRIAKNTLLLYFRMVIVTLVGLYTSRVILQSLGTADFGLFNVIGGVVTLFAFFRTSMEKCTQRFLNVEMAKEDGRLSATFSNAVIIQIAFTVIAFVFAETIGLWFLNTYIQIPAGREFAANCVYQAAVGGLLLTILTIPFSACIIAHERMGIFALISISECVLNLCIAICISQSMSDRLIDYAILLFLVRVVTFVFYVAYCFIRFKETHGRLAYDKELCRQLLGYTSWTLLGHLMIMGANHGNSILVNMFHGVGANAAMAVANQVNGHVLNLTGNFQTAFNPQITKSYALQDFDYLNKLVVSTSKLSYLLLFVVSLPLFLNIDLILGIWLVDVPAETNVFCILMICSGILQATTSPLNFSIMATGQIKWFQIVTGLVFISDLFILYALFKLGMAAPTAMVVKLFIMVMVTIVRICFAHHLIPSLKVSHYIREVLFPLLITSVICITVALPLMRLANTVAEQIVVTTIVVMITLSIVYFIGLSKRERKMLKGLVGFK